MYYERFLNQSGGQTVIPSGTPLLWILVIVFFIYVGKLVYETYKNSTTSIVEGPPTTEELGRCSWTLLHTTVSKYPTLPSNEDKTNMSDYLRLFARLYPCIYCSEHMSEYLEKHPPDVTSKDNLQVWLCKLHNDVNRKLQKPLFDCQDIINLENRWNNSNRSICPVRKTPCTKQKKS